MKTAKFLSIENMVGDYGVRKGVTKRNENSFFRNNNVMYGGNGSYMISNSGRTYLFLAAADGKNYEFNIRSILKTILNGKRITEKLISKLSMHLDNIEFNIDEKNLVVNLKEILSLALKNGGY